MNRFTENNYDHYMMGPDAYVLTEELVERVKLDDASKILDLACGKALSSVCLAHHYPTSHIFAIDLFVSARKNYNRILIQELSQQITPLVGEAAALPFSYYYFDAIFCIDAFQIFGNSASFIDEHIAPFLKLGGKLALMIPGFTEDFISMPEALQPFPIQDLDLYSRKQWEDVFNKSEHLTITDSFLMLNHERAWEAWLNSGQPGTLADRQLYEKGGQYISSLGFVLTKTTKSK